MKVLAVETATSWQSVAILDDSRVLARHDQDAAGSHAKLLLPTIDRLFRETGLTLKQLDGLAVSIGPGSFTGLRVGLATLLGSRLIVRNPRSVARPTRSPVKDPGPIDTTRPSNCLSVRPVSRNNRSIVGSNSLACDPAASWS